MACIASVLGTLGGENGVVQMVRKELGLEGYVGGKGEDITGSSIKQRRAFVFSPEASMIHWTRQIKEVLSAQETVETGENLGPLEEIEFWRNRCMDLSGISSQLVKEGVKHIESILHLAKSSYLTPFMKLAQQIQVCG